MWLLPQRAFDLTSFPSLSFRSALERWDKSSGAVVLSPHGARFLSGPTAQPLRRRPPRSVPVACVPIS